MLGLFHLQLFFKWIILSEEIKFQMFISLIYQQTNNTFDL